MTNKTLAPELRAQLSKAAKAAELLRSAAERIDSQDPEESCAELSARLRGAAVLGHTAALELAAVSGWLEAFTALELQT